LAEIPEDDNRYSHMDRAATHARKAYAGFAACPLIRARGRLCQSRVVWTPGTKPAPLEAVWT